MDFFDFSNEQQKAKRNVRKPRDAGAASSGTPESPDALSVGQLTSLIERAIKEGLPPSVLVKGEISNFKLHSGSGHAYFTLKDNQACIDCVMFRGEAARLRFMPEDGMETIASGRVSIYAQRGRYQLYVTALQPLGQGALELAFRQLCEKLQKEGLFEPERKKPIPAYPMRVALVTGASTAAMQDMLKVLRRFPWIQLMLFPVLVQGEGAAQQIANAIGSLADASKRGLGNSPDVILLARGGGSLEDLWSFNEEIVARAIVACPIPIITGIGHEVDVSIADLVADHHAHTPTEAAQVATGQWRSATEQLEASQLRLGRALRNLAQEARQQLAAIERHEFFRRPTDRIDQARQRLDDHSADLTQVMRDRLAETRLRVDSAHRRMLVAGGELVRTSQRQLTELELSLRQHHPTTLLRLASGRLDALGRQLNSAARAMVVSQTKQLDGMQKHLNAVGPEQVLQRGYSITAIKKTGQVVRSKGQLSGGEKLVTRLADGTIISIAEDPNQPTLF